MTNDLQSFRDRPIHARKERGGGSVGMGGGRITRVASTCPNRSALPGARSVAAWSPTIVCGPGPTSARTRSAIGRCGLPATSGSTPAAAASAAVRVPSGNSRTSSAKPGPKRGAKSRAPQAKPKASRVSATKSETQKPQSLVARIAAETLKIQTGRDWSETLFLPKTDFPMKAGLPEREPELLKRWLGVRNGWELATCEVDLTVGGAYRFVWRGPDGAEMGMGGVYREIVRPERLVSTERFDDPWYEGEAMAEIALVEHDG